MKKTLLLIFIIFCFSTLQGQVYVQKECRFFNNATNDTSDGLGYVIKTADGGYLFAGTGIDGVEIDPDPFGQNTYFSASSAEFLKTDVDLNIMTSSCYSDFGYDERKDIRVVDLSYGSYGEPHKFMHMFYLHMGTFDEHLKIETNNYQISFIIPGMDYTSDFFYDWERKKYLVTSSYEQSNNSTAFIYQIDTAGNYVSDKMISNFSHSVIGFDSALDNYYFLGKITNSPYPVLFATDTTGIILWAKSYITTDTIYPNNLFISNNSIYIVSFKLKMGKYDWVLHKLDKNGNTQFCKTYSYANNYAGRAVIEKQGCVYLLAGWHNWFTPSYSTLIKLDTLGNFINSKSLPLSYNFCYNDSLSNNLVIAGSKFLKLSLNMDIDSLCPPSEPPITLNNIAVLDSIVSLSIIDTTTITDCWANCNFTSSFSNILYNTTCSYPIPVSQQSIIKDDPGIKVFPNPGTDLIRINFSNFPEFNNANKLEVKSLEGYSLIRKNISLKSGTSIDLNISNLNPGIYFLYIEMRDRTTYIRKLVKN